MHQAVYDELRRVANRQEMTTYGAIAPLAGLDMNNPADRDAMRRLLGDISTHEHRNGRPLLTAVVVHKQDNVPGHGFFELAQQLGLLRPEADQLAFFCREVARVHAQWETTRV